MFTAYNDYKKTVPSIADLKNVITIPGFAAQSACSLNTPLLCPIVSQNLANAITMVPSSLTSLVPGLDSILSSLK